MRSTDPFISCFTCVLSVSALFQLSINRQLIENNQLWMRGKENGQTDSELESCILLISLKVRKKQSINYIRLSILSSLHFWKYLHFVCNQRLKIKSCELNQSMHFLYLNLFHFDCFVSDLFLYSSSDSW